MDEIAIRDPWPGDADELEALITAHFSEGSSYGVDLGIGDPTYHVLVAVDVDAPDAPLGVMALREFEGRAAVADEMYFFDDPDPLPDAKRYGHLEMGYVRDGATGRGIGSRLLGRLHEIGAERGVDLFLADSWYHSGADSPEKLFDRHGYEAIHREPIERPASECPKCETECTCEAALAVRWVDAEE